MTGTDHGQDFHACGGDVAAYALDALDPQEAEAFRAHLETCAVCRDELEAFEQTVGMLPMSAPQHRAPRGLRRRVLRAVAAEPKAHPGAAPTRRLGLPGLRSRPALALAATLAAVAIALVGVELGNSGAPASRTFAATSIASPGGSAEIRVTNGRGELIVRHFSPPPAGEIYEVWLARPGRKPEPTSALFSVTAAGDGDVAVPGSLRGVTQVMVTPEPAGGSQAPTHPAVLRVRLD